MLWDRVRIEIFWARHLLKSGLDRCPLADYKIGLLCKYFGLRKPV